MAAAPKITRLMLNPGEDRYVLYLTSPDNTPCTYICGKLQKGPAPDKLIVSATIDSVEQLSLIITTPDTTPSSYLGTPYSNIVEGSSVYDTVYNLVIIAYSKIGNPPIFP